MEFDQPCEVNGFTFKCHALGHLLRNGLPAQPATCRVRQRPPAINDFYITHAGTIAIVCVESNFIARPAQEYSIQSASSWFAASNNARILFPADLDSERCASTASSALALGRKYVR